MSPQEIGLTLSLFPSPPSTLPPPPPALHRSKSNKFMAPGTTSASSQPRPELALYYFNSPTMLPQQKKPIPLMPSNTDNVVDVVMADGKGPETRKRERSPLPSLEDSEKGNKRKSPRKMRSSPFLAAATGHFFQAARSFSSSASSSSPSAAVAARPGTSPKADGTTGGRDGDTVTSPPTTHPNASNNAEMETVKVISRAVRQRVAQSSSPSTAASAITVDTAAPARSVEVECTSPVSSSASVPPAPSSSSSKSPFKKRRLVVKAERKPSPLRNTPLTASDFLASSSSSSRAAASSPAPSTSPSKEKKVVKRKPVVWEKRPLLQKVILKEFERTPHGAEILRRGAKLGIAFLEEQRHLVRSAEQSRKSGRKSTSSDEDETAEGVVLSVKSKSKDVSSMKHWGRIVKTALAGPLKEMAGPMAGDGRPPMPMIRAW